MRRRGRNRNGRDGGENPAAARGEFLRADDMGRNVVALFSNEWAANYFAQNNPRLPLTRLAPTNPTA